MCSRGFIQAVAFLATSGFILAYTPSHDVRSAHNIPTVKDFEATKPYVSAILAFPIALIVLGILSLIGYISIFYYLYLSGAKKNADGSEYRDMNKLYVKESHFVFGIFMAFSVITTFFVFIGNRDLTRILRETAYAIEYYATRLQTSHDAAQGVVAHGNHMYNSYIGNLSSPCHIAMNATHLLSNYTTDANLIINYATTAGDSTATIEMLHKFRDVIFKKLIPGKDAIVFVLFTFSLISIITMISSYLKTSKEYLKLSLYFMELMVLVLTVIAAIEMAIVHGIGDVCMDPSGALNRAFGEQDKTSPNYNLIPYYTKCQGSSSSSLYFQQTGLAVRNTGTLLNNTKGQLGGHIVAIQGRPLSDTACLSGIGNDLNASGLILLSLLPQQGCSKTMAVFVSAIEEGLCKGGLSGFLGVWLTHILTALFFFIAMICIGYYFDHFEKQKDATEELYDKNVFGFVYRSPRDMSARGDPQQSKKVPPQPTPNESTEKDSPPQIDTTDTKPVENATSESTENSPNKGNMERTPSFKLPPIFSSSNRKLMAPVITPSGQRHGVGVHDDSKSDASGDVDNNTNMGSNYTSPTFVSPAISPYNDNRRRTMSVGVGIESSHFAEEMI